LDKKFQQCFEGQKKVRKLIANFKSFRNTSENKLVETTEGSEWRREMKNTRASLLCIYTETLRKFLYPK